MSPRVFPTIMIALSLGAAVMYGMAGSWRRCIYWIAAAILNTTVTY